MFGDVFICQFPFTSGASSKIRPALVLFDLEQDATWILNWRISMASRCLLQWARRPEDATQTSALSNRKATSLR
jgi:hypothetical protein